MIKKTSVLLAVISIFIFLVSCATAKREHVEFTPPVFPPPPEKPRFIWERMFVSSADVKEQTAMDKFRQFATGSRSTAEGLSKPWGVAVYHGRIYVTDTVSRNVAMFDVPGRNFKLIGTKAGPGQLTKPIAIATSKVDGTVYVTDITARRVVAYDKDGNFLRALGGRQVFLRPTGVAVSPDGLTLWVVDNGGVDSQDHHLFKFDAISGELLKTIGTRGREEGEFNLPLEAATGPDGTVYVVDGGNFRVEAFNPDGSFKLTFGAIGVKSGQFSRPKGIATDPEGNIYVVDSSFGNFQIFTPKGKLLLYIGEHSFKGMPANYVLPAGITVDADGRVYVVDQYYRRIDVYRPADLPANQGYLSAGKPPADK
jgi:DNA-binding beta-propeller fold protein YncE